MTYQTCEIPLWNLKYSTRNIVLSIAFRTTSETDYFNLSSFCRDSPQDHVATSHSPTWNVSHEKPYQRMVIPQNITSANPHSPFANVSPPNYGPFSSPTMGQYSNLASPIPSRVFQVPNFGRLSLSTAGSSNASSSESIPRPTSSMTSGRRTATIEAPSRPHPFSYRRSNTSSASIVSYLCKVSLFLEHFWYDHL